MHLTSRVDEDVETAEHVDGLVEHRLDGCLLPGVEFHHERFAAGGSTWRAVSVARRGREVM